MSKDTTGTYEGTTRRKVIQTLGAGTAATALAGCGSLLDDESGEGSLTIGHVGPEASVLGVGSVRAAELAVSKVNDEGGVQDEDVELLTGDTAVSSTEAESVVEELIRQEDADVIVGAFQSEVGRALVDLTADFGVPYISTGPAAPELTRGFVGEDYETYKHYFRVGPINSDLQAEGMRDYMVYLSDEHGWNSLAFFRDQAAWTGAFGDLLPGFAEEEGLTIENNNGNGRALSIQDPDLAPVVSTANELGVDYVLRFFAHISASPQQIYPQWAGNELDWGLEGIHVPGMHPEYDVPVQGTNLYETTSQTGAGGVTNFNDGVTFPFIEEYVDEYAESEFNAGTPDGAPMYMGMGTYDAVLLLQEVLNEAGTTAPADNLDDYVDAMLGAELEGASGTIEFYEQDAEYPHDLVAERDSEDRITNFPVTQWQPNDGDTSPAHVEYGDERPGKVECVFSDQYRTSDHMMPAWMA